MNNRACTHEYMYMCVPHNPSSLLYAEQGRISQDVSCGLTILYHLYRKPQIHAKYLMQAFMGTCWVGSTEARDS